MKRTAFIATVIVATWILNGIAADKQDELQGPSNVKRIGSSQGENKSQQGSGGDKQGPEKGNAHRPVPPLIKALDANGDGVIDADEIANAPAALKKLDKNGDGKLTRDEIMPPRPPRPDGEQGPGMGQGGGEGPQNRGGHKDPPPQDGADKQ